MMFSLTCIFIFLALSFVILSFLALSFVILSFLSLFFSIFILSSIPPRVDSCLLLPLTQVVVEVGAKVVGERVEVRTTARDRRAAAYTELLAIPPEVEAREVEVWTRGRA